VRGVQVTNVDHLVLADVICYQDLGIHVIHVPDVSHIGIDFWIWAMDLAVISGIELPSGVRLAGVDRLALAIVLTGGT
jgi:hypothetical protein